MIEEWRDIPGYEGLYQVSNTGKVRSMNYRRSGLVAELKQKNVKGYRYVDLVNKNGIKMLSVHRLIIETFIGPCPEGKQVNHVDGDPCNNNVSNLEYVTAAENIQHSFAHLGRQTCPGAKNGKAKLTDDKVREILKLRKSGVKTKDIAKAFGVGSTTINNIGNGLIWKHIERL